MGNIADRLLGVLVDENSCRTIYNADYIEKTYDIVGLKAFNVRDFSTFDIRLQYIKINISYTDINSFEHRYLHIKEYRDGRPIGYSISYSKYQCGKRNGKVLPVYGSSGKFLFSLNGNAFYMDFVYMRVSNHLLNGLRVKIDVHSETVELVIDKCDSLPINYFSKRGVVSSSSMQCVHFNEVKSLFEKYNDCILKYGSICVVKEIVEGTIVVPDDCKYLIVDDSPINKLVLNANLDTIICHPALFKTLKTIYTSKYSSKNLMGSLLWGIYLHHNIYYKYSKRDEASDLFYSKLKELKDCGEFSEIWDDCNHPRRRKEMKAILNGIEIVVY
jgi:hypothetical protein